jgi:hypothetical protein
MSVKWISAKPKDPVCLFNDTPMEDAEYENLMHHLIHVRKRERVYS